MNESKTQCATCGTTILERTAAKHNGLCVPCHGRAIARPPDNFEIPHDLAQRIVSRNEDPRDYRDSVWREGADHVHDLLDRLDHAAAECRRWSPRLRAFAIECRRVAPAPSVDELTGLALQQYRLLRMKMSEFVRSRDSVVVAGRKFQVPIISASRVGLPAAKEVFSESGAVILEASEPDRWFAEVSQIDSKARWLFALAWWIIDVETAGGQAAGIHRNRPVSPEGSYWVVRSGVQWGPLHGGEHTELWRWNGDQAEFIERLEDVSF